MKILFICGSLENGRDGVGDYVRRLSLEVVRHGHQVALTAVNDRHINEVQQSSEAAGTESIVLLRLPEVMDEKDRFRALQEWIAEIDPDWLSLQFVPFSFNRRGLIFGLANQLKRLGAGRKWHIMFHELWLGMDAESGQKESVWGMVQRFLNRNLLKGLKPALVHTHTGLYKKQLEKLGITVELLPLFSNIPVSSPAAVQKKLDSTAKGTEKDLLIFGGIHGGAPVEQLAKEVAGYAKANGTTWRLIVVGKSGQEQARWVNAWEAEGLTVSILGEQPEEKVSELLAGARHGIFTTPLALVEKSGSVAAMREHGIDLLCVSRQWTPREILADKNPFGIEDYAAGKLGAFLNRQPDFSYLPTIGRVAEQFISNLKNSN